MLPLLQSLTIVGMIGATYFVYQTFGPRQLSFSFTKARETGMGSARKRQTWKLLTVNSIFATITSFATVYVFFIGNTQQFGWWIVFPVLTIWGGGFITNYFTRILVSRRHIANGLRGDQSRAVLLSSRSGRNEREHPVSCNRPDRRAHEYPGHSVAGTLVLPMFRPSSLFRKAFGGEQYSYMAARSLCCTSRSASAFAVFYLPISFTARLSSSE